MIRMFLPRALRVLAMFKNIGFWAAFSWVVRRLLNGRDVRAGINVFAHYDYVFACSNVALKGDYQSKDINWFIPDFNVGSGGHLNIFRIIWHLEKKGYTSHIVIARPQQHTSEEDARRDVVENFFPVNAQISIGLSHLPLCKFAVATGWDTAYDVRNFAGAQIKTYFVQDFEPWFYALGSDYLLAENTYRFGFYGITAGTWLAHKLRTEYDMQTSPVGFGVEQERYIRTPRRDPNLRRVFFYARPPTPRRAFELGLLVLNEVAKRLPGTQFILAGWDTTAYHIPFPHLSCGTVSLDELPDLYSQCDVALVLSLTNLSLLPLELMSCGCVVVSNKGPNVEWLLTHELAVLADPSPEALSSAISDLLEDDVRLQRLSEKGQDYARQFHWQGVADEFANALESAERSQNAKEVTCAV
jgi:O-antigen biosynthesis protein